MELLGHMAVLFSIFKGISTLFSIVAVLDCIPTKSVRGFPFPTPSRAFIACRLLDSSHSDWHEMVPHCGFYLHFSDNEHLFMCFLAICMSSSENLSAVSLSQKLLGSIVVIESVNPTVRLTSALPLL